MSVDYKPFQEFFVKVARVGEMIKLPSVEIKHLDVSEDEVNAVVQEKSAIYRVAIDYNSTKLKKAFCSCSYNGSGVCRHIIKALIASAPKAKELHYKKESEFIPIAKFKGPKIEFEKKGKEWELLNLSVGDVKMGQLLDLKKDNPAYKKVNGQWYTRPIEFEPNHLTLKVFNPTDYGYEKVKINKVNEKTFLSCSCKKSQKSIPCVHIFAALLDFANNPQYKWAFNEESRLKRLRMSADRDGMGAISDELLQEIYKFEIINAQIYVNKTMNILDLRYQNVTDMAKEYVPKPFLPESNSTATMRLILLESLSSPLSGFAFHLIDAPLAKTGKIKNPLNYASINKGIATCKNREEILFYSAFGEQPQGDLFFQKWEPSLTTIKDILKNPFDLPFYRTDYEIEDDLPKASFIEPVLVRLANPDITLTVKQQGQLYSLSFKCTFEGKSLKVEDVFLENGFLDLDSEIYYIADSAILKIISFFMERGKNILITESQFEPFQNQLLSQWEQKVTVKYDFVKKAPKKLVKKLELNQPKKNRIYLSESAGWVLVTPVAVYPNNTEVPVLSKQALRVADENGILYEVERDVESENDFIEDVKAQFPNAEDYPTNNFYFIKNEDFFDPGWFMEAFKVWQDKGYEILGLKEINKENLNMHPMSVNMGVSSGIDWFDIETEVSFGDQKVSLRDLRKSVLNKNRFVLLGDGTKGLLPEAWFQKFEKYFRIGEIKGDTIRTGKSNFRLIDTLFEKEILSKEVKKEIKDYQTQLKKFTQIKDVAIPSGLNATLRNYQKEGLNWLNFLDEFHFGGILADDMGLGKTIQIIAYLLTQKEKDVTEPNLIVVPTSLLFNWEQELKKFAPTLSFERIYGTNRNVKETLEKGSDILLTTYGTLLSDITELKEISFNVVVLDESQAIKNIASQRYKAVRLLRAKRRIAATGTPVENNTFDLYAQLSFVMPGLLGSQKKFKDDYAIPIDKFQSEEIAQELKEKLFPFILRRTKKQVAKELPEKTEMVVTCEMKPQQRKLYDTYKAEFQKYLLKATDQELQKSSLNVLQGLTKLRQICNSPALLSDEEYYGDQSAKLDELMHQVNKLRDQHKILVFSQFVGMLELVKAELEKNGIGYSYLTGQTRKRQEVVEEFQEQEDKRVFLISLKAGGTGLNLTQAEYVFLVDPWWNPAVENQAIDRAYRIGQKNHVIAIRLITPDSIEEKIMQLQERKLKLVQDLIHTEKNSFKNLTKDDLLNLL